MLMSRLNVKNLKSCRSDIPLILTYVFNNRIKESENRIKNFVNEIFYKPFDLNEITARIPALITHRLRYSIF